LVEMVHVGGQLHTDIYCPKCEAEMTELEFDRKDMGKFVLWECYRKCSKCGIKIEM
jgi:hypothetical protein